MRSYKIVMLLCGTATVGLWLNTGCSASSAAETPDAGTPDAGTNIEPTEGGAADAGVSDAKVRTACYTECAADATTAKRKVCGTDKQTYDLCTWFCREVPAGVGVYPAACEKDGSPKPGSPSQPADGLEVCSFTRINGEWNAIPCETPSGGTGGNVYTDAPAPTVPSLPVSVDHRDRFSGVRSQGNANTCVTFATAAAIESASATLGLKGRISEMHLFSRYATTHFDDAFGSGIAGISSNGAANTAGLSYSGNRANQWFCWKTPGLGMCKGNNAVVAETPPAVTITTLDGQRVVKVDTVSKLKPLAGNQKLTAVQLQNVLAAGFDIPTSVSISAAWEPRDANDNPDGVDGSGVIRDYNGATGGHAVLLVGYLQVAGKLHFILRNSWGTSWADGGYAYISAQMLEKYGGGAYWLKAKTLP